MYKRVRNTNAWLEREGNTVRLMSYETLICEVNNDSKTVLLSPSAMCSRTTIRHLSSFLREFDVSYYAAKNVIVHKHSDLVETCNGYTISVSFDPRFKFKPTGPYCLL